jgi:hypothetical protein
MGLQRQPLFHGFRGSPRIGNHKNKTWGNSNTQAVAVPPKVFLPLQLSIRDIREIRGKTVAVAVAYPFKSSRNSVAKQLPFKSSPP